MRSCVWLFATPWTAARQAPLSWDYPGKKTGSGCHALLQGIFPPQGLNLGLLPLLHRWDDSLRLALPMRHLQTEGQRNDATSEWQIWNFISGSLVSECEHFTATQCYLQKWQSHQRDIAWVLTPGSPLLNPVPPSWGCYLLSLRSSQTHILMSETTRAVHTTWLLRQAGKAGLNVHLKWQIKKPTPANKSSHNGNLSLNSRSSAIQGNVLTMS